MMTSEQGDVTVMSERTVNQDCMYTVRPEGNATLYKLWLDDVILNQGDLIDVSHFTSLIP